MTFGDFLRSKRKDAGMSQRDFAKGLGISFPYISKIETGAMEPPSEEILIAMGYALNVNIHEMVIRAGKIPNDFKRLILEDEEVFKYLQHKALKYT